MFPNVKLTTGHLGQMYQEPFQNRKPRKKWGIKEVGPYVRKHETLKQTVKTSAEEVKRYEAALKEADAAQVSTAEAALETAKWNHQGAQLRLDEFLKSLPFPAYKL